MGPLLKFSKCHPDKYLEEGSSRWLSHEQVIGRAGGCRDFYDPVAKYMEGLGEGNDWSCLCLKHQFAYHSLLPLSVSFLSIEHHARTIILGKLLDWLH